MWAAPAAMILALLACVQLAAGAILLPDTFFMTVHNLNNNISMQVPYESGLFGGAVIGNVSAPILVSYPDIRGCVPLNKNSTDRSGRSFAGSWMLIQRGSCSFGSKALQAQLIGAVGVIIFSCGPPCPNDFSDMSGTQNVSIPSVMIRYLAGTELQSTIDAGTRLNATIEGTGPTDPSDLAALQLMMQQNSDLIPDEFGGGTRAWPTILTSSDDPCLNRVSGIWCIRGRVWAIKLPFLQYTGPIPAAVGQLTALREIVWDNNALTGSIPTSWCNLVHLKRLTLGFNYISGVPACASQWTELGYFDISGNLVESLPFYLPSWTSIYRISIAGNFISSLSGFGALNNLQLLDASHNGVVAVLPNFSNWTHLQKLSLSGNAFYGTVARTYFDNLPELTSLDLSNNDLTGPIPDFNNTNAITRLDLSYNRFYGEVTLTFGRNMPNLVSLFLQHNKFVSPVGAIVNLNKLIEVDMSYNQLTSQTFDPTQQGQLGAVIFSLIPPSAARANFEHNNFTGTWTAGWLSLQRSLTHLKLAYNQISTLPPDLFEVTAAFDPTVLNTVDLSFNNLTGTMPAGQPPASLEVLKLDGNPFFRGPELPFWASTASDLIVDRSGLYLCSRLTGLGGQVYLSLDPSYLDYSSCACTIGTYGAAPACYKIPIVTNSTGAGNSPLQAAWFADSAFGNLRATPGIDTSWVLAPPPGTVVIYISFNFTSSFTEFTDLIQVYEGDANLNGDVVEALRGSTETDEDGESDVFHVRVFSSMATVNFRSRATEGVHFNATWWWSRDCPTGFHVGETSGRCESGFTVGDLISNKPDATIGVLAYGVAVLGSWTSLILTEQVIYHHLAGERTYVWVGLASASLGVAMWSSIVIGVSSLQVGGVPILYFVYASVLSVLVSVGLCALAMTLIVSRAKVMDRKVLNADSSAYKPLTDPVGKAPNEPGAVVSTMGERIWWIIRLFDFYLLVAGALLMTGLGGVHFIILNGMNLPCDTKYTVAINVVALAFGVVFLTVAIFLYYAFRTNQWRFMSAFIMALGIIAFHFIALNGVEYRFNGALPLSSSARAEYMDSGSMQLMGSISTALMCFLFVGLNVIRLKLSRDQLDANVQEKDLQILELEERVRTYELHLADLQRKIALTSLVRPLVRPNHFLLHAVAADAVERAKEHDASSASGVLVRSDSKKKEIGFGSEEKKAPGAGGGAGGVNGPTSFSVGAALSLHELLANPVCVELLKDKMTANFNTENLAFLLDVEAYKQAWAGEQAGMSSGLPLWSSTRHAAAVAAPGGTPVSVLDGAPDASAAAAHNPQLALTNDRLRAMAADIFWTYIPENSVHQVNLSADSRNAVAKKYLQSAAPVKSTVGEAASAAILAKKGTKAQAFIAAASATASSPTRSGASKPARDVFAVAEREVLMLIERNDMLRFCESDAFKTCMLLLKSMPPPPKIKPFRYSSKATAWVSSPSNAPRVGAPAGPVKSDDDSSHGNINSLHGAGGGGAMNEVSNDEIAATISSAAPAGTFAAPGTPGGSARTVSTSSQQRTVATPSIAAAIGVPLTAIQLGPLPPAPPPAAPAPAVVDFPTATGDGPLSAGAPQVTDTPNTRTVSPSVAYTGPGRASAISIAPPPPPPDSN